MVILRSCNSNDQPDRQCMYNVTLTSVSATIVALGNQWLLHIWVCIWSLWYPADNAHAPYCLLWLAQLYSIFPHYLIKSTIFEKKKLLDLQCVLWYIYIYIYIYIYMYITFVWNSSHYKNNQARYNQKAYRGFRIKYPLFSSDLTLRRLMLYIYGAPILDVSRSHTTTQHSR